MVREQGYIYSLSFLVLFTWVLSLFFLVNLIRGLSVSSLNEKQLFIFYFYIVFISIISSLIFIISFPLLTFGFVVLLQVVD